MFCVNCGCANNEDAKFCQKCGKSLVLSNTEEYKVPRDKKLPKSKLPFFAVGIIVVVLIVGGMVIFFTGEKTVENNAEISQNVDDAIENKSENSQVVQIKREESIYHYTNATLYEGYETNEYDENGNLVYTETDYGKWNYAYDFYPDGSPAVQYTYTLDGILSYEIHYDEYGNIVKEEISGDDSVESYEYVYKYDTNGNIVEKVTYWYIPAEGIILNFYDRITFVYDEDNKIIMRSHYYDEYLQEATLEYRYEYDENGNLILFYLYDETMPDNVGYETEYDVLANTEKIYSNNGFGELYFSEYIEYNDEQDMLIRVLYDENGNEIDFYEYEYEYIKDDSGNMIEENVYVNGELYKTIKREYY